ncbi:conserved hypothetical protein [Methanothermobacter sp. MT-2]|nr:conserved hypothetical protein [Methanothermobacter sp. MT-2]
MRRTPSSHKEFLGLHFTLNSLQGHGEVTYAIPLFESMVVNGYDATSAFERVAALKKDDLPTFGFPVIPISIIISHTKKVFTYIFPSKLNL